MLCFRVVQLQHCKMNQSQRHFELALTWWHANVNIAEISLNYVMVFPLKLLNI